MATLRKSTYTKLVPADAKIIAKGGKQLARFAHKGKTITAPITIPAKGKLAGRECVQVERPEWYIRYKDHNGKWQEEKAYTDKDASQKKAVEIQQRVDRKLSGHADPFEDHHRRPLIEHVDDFDKFLCAKGTSTDYHGDTLARLHRTIKGCGFERIADLSASAFVSWLGDVQHSGETLVEGTGKIVGYRRVGDYFGVTESTVGKWKRDGAPLVARKPIDLAAVAEWLNQRADRGKISPKTANHYIASMKLFTRWLKRDRRMGDDPLAHLSMLDTSRDIRRERRAIGSDEFARLVAAAEAGGPVEGVIGVDRAMLYILAAWTGFRRKELASLTLRSFNLTAETPVVRVLAAHAKGKRTDEVPLHTAVVERLRAWLPSKADLAPGDHPLQLRAAGGSWRKTSKMMKVDLASARARWIGEAETDAERDRREQSDFLTYQDEDGAFADFHANRHTFISNLGKAGVPLATAQKLARHSTPALTANVYTHLEISDKASAIESLPAPPKRGDDTTAGSHVLQATGTDDGRPIEPPETLSAPPVPQGTGKTGQFGAHAGTKGVVEEGVDESPQTLKIKGLGTPKHTKSRVETSGLEPPTPWLQTHSDGAKAPMRLAKVEAVPHECPTADDLAVVVEAWPRLSKSIRGAIMELVE